MLILAASILVVGNRPPGQRALTYDNKVNRTKYQGDVSQS